MDSLKFHQPVVEDGPLVCGCVVVVRSVPRERGKGGRWR